MYPLLARCLVLLLGRFIAAYAVLGLASAPAAIAQPYPSKAIKMIAPYPPGGGVDVVARAVAERLSAKLGQPVTVENKPGAGATIGADALVKSAPDGYTLMLGSVVDYSIAPHIHKQLGFDMRRDFSPIVEIGYGTVGMVVAPNVPATSLKELIALLKAKPGEYSFASSGTGGLIHLNGEMFKQMAGVDIVHVPYKGSTQFIPDMLSGRIPMSVDNVLPHLQNAKSGKVRILAVASRTRSPLLPEVPTMAEAGLPGFESATNYTLFAPAATPRDIVVPMNAAINAFIMEPDFRDKMLSLGIVVTGGSPDTVRAFIAGEIDRWTRVIKAANLKLD